MHKHTKKLLSLALCTSLLIAATDIFAVLPPQYLNVENFQQCLATKDMGTWKAWCIPDTKPDSCPDQSWQQLNGLTGKDKIPSC